MNLYLYSIVDDRFSLLPYSTVTHLFTACTPPPVGADGGPSPPPLPAQPFPASHSIGKGI